MSTRPLTRTGRPMDALRALAGANRPLHEDEVYQRAKRTPNDIAMFHGPLRTLVARGFAERSGVHGGYCWAITDAGREALS